MASIKDLKRICEMQEHCAGCPLSRDEFSCMPESLPDNIDEIVDKWVAEHPAKTYAEEADKVNHPAHYQGKHECIDEMIALFGVEAVKGFCKCNVHKYRYRAEAKGGQEDLDKANWYMDKLMELEGAEK